MNKYLSQPINFAKQVMKSLTTGLQQVRKLMITGKSTRYAEAGLTGKLYLVMRHVMYSILIVTISMIAMLLSFSSLLGSLVTSSSDTLSDKVSQVIFSLRRAQTRDGT